jgi:hypothetical protein
VIKFKGTVADIDGGSRDVVVLGLTGENLDQLRDGVPLQIDTSQPVPEGVGLTGGPVVFVFADKDEAMVLRTLKKAGAVDDETHVVFSQDLAPEAPDDAA